MSLLNSAKSNCDAVGLCLDQLSRVELHQPKVLFEDTGDHFMQGPRYKYLQKKSLSNHSLRNICNFLIIYLVYTFINYEN